MWWREARKFSIMGFVYSEISTQNRPILHSSQPSACCTLFKFLLHYQSNSLSLSLSLSPNHTSTSVRRQSNPRNPRGSDNGRPPPWIARNAEIGSAELAVCPSSQKVRKRVRTSISCVLYLVLHCDCFFFALSPFLTCTFSVALLPDTARQRSGQRAGPTRRHPLRHRTAGCWRRPPPTASDNSPQPLRCSLTREH